MTILEPQIEVKKGTYEWALAMAREGYKIKRKAFRDTCHIEIQFPTDLSKMTKPYLIMIKGENIFPVPLSCESIFAEDWIAFE